MIPEFPELPHREGIVARHRFFYKDMRLQEKLAAMESLWEDLVRTLAHIIHERFCCNRGFAAATSLSASVLAA